MHAAVHASVSDGASHVAASVTSRRERELAARFRIGRRLGRLLAGGTLQGGPEALQRFDAPLRAGRQRLLAAPDGGGGVARRVERASGLGGAGHQHQRERPADAHALTLLLTRPPWMWLFT